MVWFLPRRTTVQVRHETIVREDRGDDEGSAALSRDRTVNWPRENRTITGS